MLLQLKNEYIALHIQKPGLTYRGARFDWTGQIIQIQYLNKHTFCTTESLNEYKINQQGRGLYNEFGINKPVGYDECKVDEQFLKIGVGLLTRESKAAYDFFHHYKITPGEILFFAEPEKAVFQFRSNVLTDYACQLEKEISLHGSTFTIKYKLSNLGNKTIHTHEYVHNFLAINNRKVGPGYRLVLPSQIDSRYFGEHVNPANQVRFNAHVVHFFDDTDQVFFFSNIHSGQTDMSSWSLEHVEEKIGIQESVDFEIEAINLWGSAHVISPEIFCPIHVLPGEIMTWSRTYRLYTLENEKNTEKSSMYPEKQV